MGKRVDKARMPTSVATTSNASDDPQCRPSRLGSTIRDCTGFTLLELSLVMLIIGVVLALMGSMGRAVGGRRHYF